jgi:hypothetical protein
MDSGQIAKDSERNNTVTANLVLKIPVLNSATASRGKGNIIYDTNTNSILVSDGIGWSPAGAPVSLGGDVTGPLGANLITSLQSVPVHTPLVPNPQEVLTFDGAEWTSLPITGALPLALQSITTVSNTMIAGDMLYAVASNTYAKTGTSALGRGFLSYTTQGQQQTALGLTIGGTVQAHSTILDSVVTTAATTDQMIVSSAGIYTNVNTNAYGRSLLAETSQAALLTTLDVVEGRSALTTITSVPVVSSSGVLGESGVFIDAFNNITGVNNITFSGANSVTAAEFSQLSTLGATTISSSQWGYLGSMDQPVDSVSTPTFASLTLNGIINMSNNKIQNVTDPTLSQDAATKQYVDTVASTGAPPLASATYATDSVLPNAPVYSYPTLTSTAGAGVALVIDGHVMTLTDETNAVRVLVKDESTSSNNGVYVLTSYGGGASAWQLTRSSDFDNTSLPIPAGTSIFVDIVAGLSNSATTWAVGAVILTFASPVTFVQIGGVPTYSAGAGIDSTSLIGGTIALINPVATATGGTGANFSVNTGNVVVTGNATMTATKVAPSGAFVGTTDIQAISNKTFTLSTITDPTNTVRATQLATTGADVVLSAGAPGATGQVLTLTSPTAAIWTALPVILSPSRTLFVYQGASNVSPNYSTLTAAVTAAIALVPTSTNWVKIEMFPGIFSETTPLYIPPFISLTGLVSAQSDVIVRPAAPAAIGAVLQSKGNVRVSGIVINGADGAGGYSSIGFNSYYDVTSAGTTDFLSAVTVRNCTTSGFNVAGNPVTPTQYSKILICKNCSYQITAFPFTTTIAGYDVSFGGVLSGTDTNASGYFSGGVNNLTYGYRVDGDFSTIDVNIIQASGCVNGASVGGTVISTSQGLYPLFRVNGANFGLISTSGLLVNSKSVIKVNDFKISDDTGQFPNQKHIVITNSPAASDPNYISAMYIDARTDLVTLSVSGTPSTFVGVNLNETPGIPKNLFLCGANVGFTTNPASFTAGGGAPSNLGMVVLSYNSGSATYTNLTSRVKSLSANPAVINLATTIQIDLASAPAIIDGVVPSSGVTTVLVKDGSVANPNVSGYSIDNGIYVWNGAGNPMTRYAPYATGTQYTDKTWFNIGDGSGAVTSGVVNYSSRWKLQGATSLGPVVNTGNITFGTTLLNFLTSSAQPFPTSPANGDILYIGSAGSIKFPHIYITLSALLTTTSTAYPSTAVLVWEYYTGAGWVDLSLMSISDTPPYNNYGNETFGYGDVIIPPNTSDEFAYQFGPISNNWAAIPVNGIPGYWIRVRVIDAANIVQLPVIAQILLGTNRTEINEDGFVVYYGDARPIVGEILAMNRLYGTGTTGEVAPTAVRQICSASPVISFLCPNAYWGPGVVTAACFTLAPPETIDSSSPLKLYLNVSHDASTGTQNSVWQVDYAFIYNGGGVLSINSGTGTFGTRSSGPITFPISATAGEVLFWSFSLDIAGLIPNGAVIWFKLSRLGTSVSDTYTGPVYLSNVHFEHSIWAIGKSYLLL